MSYKCNFVFSTVHKEMTTIEMIIYSFLQYFVCNTVKIVQYTQQHKADIIIFLYKKLDEISDYKFCDVLRCTLSILSFQLRHMQAKNLAFKEFKEGTINFLPTYKYDPGTDTWDSRYGPFVYKLNFTS